MITREPNTEYILSLSYGKDSIACLEAIKQLGYPAGYDYSIEEIISFELKN